MSNRKNETSMALTAVRTARSMAESAVEKIGDNGEPTEWRYTLAAWQDGEYLPGARVAYRDPDADEMIVALKAFIAATEKWARGSRKPGVVNKKMGI